MSNKFDRFVKKGLLVCVGVAAISGLLAMSYMDSKELTFEEIFEDGGFNINLNRGMIFSDFDALNIEGNISSNYSRYETKDIYEENTFEVLDNIKIISSTEDILFIEEDRDDIKVTFEREVPDTTRYTLSYDAEVTGDQIVIDLLRLADRAETGGGSVKIVTLDRSICGCPPAQLDHPPFL